MGRRQFWMWKSLSSDDRLQVTCFSDGQTSMIRTPTLLLQREGFVIQLRSSPNSHKKSSVFTSWICSLYQLLRNSEGPSWDSTPLSISSHHLRPQTRENWHLQKIYLFCKKWRLVSSISRFVSSAPHWFHVGNGHPKNCQLVGLTSQRAASGHHIGQFSDVLGHLIPPASLNFTMILPEHLEEHQTNRKADMISVRIPTGGNGSQYFALVLLLSPQESKVLSKAEYYYPSVYRQEIQATEG